MAEYRLHCFAQSGNAYKAALHLELSGADWEPVFVDFFNGETRTSEYRRVNVMGEVPLLEHAGRTLTQSGVILDYLAGTTGRFGPANDDERREIWRWILFDNHKLTSYLATHRFLHHFTQGADPAVLGFLNGRAKAALKVLDSHLDGRDFAVAGRATIADLSMVGYMYYGDELGIDVDGAFGNVARWRDRISDMAGWKHPYDLMPGHPLPPRGQTVSS
ncbi:MAG: glutathione S-transferase N-terminal domain-containing protein [Rhodobiaceae bacterium]|nr:glutathione S-transferase N-terminal domain-containing protein [Rhodobiaceae bacterium]MCC0041193.1 glutathione S-transferase N-terminal domain-containing protein [Rhodobiaceae bacterium]